MRFALEKWYLDSVTPAGDVMIGYWAALRLGPLTLRYAAILAGRAGAPLTNITTIRSGPPPTVGRDIQWVCPRLACAGTWCPTAPAVTETLYEDARGHVRWHCIAPRALTDVTVQGVAQTGIGYVEHLSLTIPPWQLPFRSLTWGRFHGTQRTRVWIAWAEGIERQWTWGNGAAGTLHLGDRHVLRTGRLRDTAFRPVRWLAALLPRWHAARETKWLSHATWSQEGGAESGWALHEEVRW